MAQQWALAGNIVIALAYASIMTAIAVPVVRAGQARTNRLAVATALIFFSCAVGHALHAAMYWHASYNHAEMPGMRETTGWPTWHAALWPTAVWDVLTAAVGIYYWTLRRGYGVLLGGTGALFVDPAEQQRRHDIELRERVAEGRAQAEAERDAQAAMLRAVITNSQSAIYVKDLTGRFLLANEALQTAFGVTGEQLLGKTDDHLDPELAPVWQANDRLAHHGPVQLEETIEVRGERRIYESNKSPLYDADGRLYAVCGVSLDVTDLRRATESAEQARDEALAQSQVKSDFLATMSHEIRTPMNGVLGLASLLMGTDLDPAQRRYATGIHSAGNALLGVINDILDFSKIEAGKVVLDPDDFDLPALLAETAALVAATAGKKGLTVVTRGSPQLPATVRGDGGRVRQILLNLAGNAVKFTTTGTVTIRAELLAAPAHVRFEVTDTGPGIAPHDADRLFEPFTQADASTTRTYGGTGLGLAISRQLTEAMGGTIGVDSEPGNGSTFWCEIPFEPSTGTATSPTPDTTGLRILVVAPGPDHAELEADLRRWQMAVSTADTATSALATLRDAATHGRHFDLVLLDADRGDVDTAGLARIVTADPAIPAVHIIVLNEDAPTSVDDSGVRAYLPKPVHRSDLYDLLAQSMAVVVPVPVTPVAPTPAGGATRGTVLLVEDNDINQMVAVGILTSLGYHADVAGDGSEACDLAAAGRYDAILMDCRMPRMDGFTATAELRRREQSTGRHTPIIAMTASALVADRERCLTAGMDDYLAKPVNPAELDAALHRWIAAPAAPAPPQVAPAPPLAAPGGLSPDGLSPGPSSPGPSSPGPSSPGPLFPGPASPGSASSPGPTSSPGPSFPGPSFPGPSFPRPSFPGPTSPGPTSPGPTSPGPTSPRRTLPAGAGRTDDERPPDPIAHRLDELAGDRTGPEIALVNRLVSSFLERAPRHAGALTEAFNAGDPQTVEDQAHSLRGAAGNIGAFTVMDVCERIENDARASALTNGTADDLRRLGLELERVERHLHELAPV